MLPPCTGYLRSGTPFSWSAGRCHKTGCIGSSLPRSSKHRLFDLKKSSVIQLMLNTYSIGCCSFLSALQDRNMLPPCTGHLCSHRLVSETSVLHHRSYCTRPSFPSFSKSHQYDLEDTSNDHSLVLFSTYSIECCTLRCLHQDPCKRLPCRSCLRSHTPFFSLCTLFRRSGCTAPTCPSPSKHHPCDLDVKLSYWSKPS